MLSGYRVLDLTEFGCLLCGKTLADLGAEVIKIEKVGGDPSRSIGPFYKNIVNPNYSLFWFAYNTNKKSITLNIESTDGQTLFKKLVKSADVVVESLPVGYLDSLGLSYEQLTEVNQRVILTSITPFGIGGPYQDYKATDLTLTAMGGWMYISGEPDRSPLAPGFGQSLLCAGGDASVGTMLALYEREQSEKGQHVIVSAQQGVCMDTREAIPYRVLDGTIQQRTGNYRVGFIKAALRQRNTWPCKDGFVFWYLFGGLAGASTNRALVEWMGSEGFANDFLMSIDWANLDIQLITDDFIKVLDDAVEMFFLNHTKKELYDGALARGVILYPVSDMKDLLEDTQLQARDFWKFIEYPELNDKILHPGAFFESSDYKVKKPRRAPSIGEHNTEIYIQELGYTVEDLERLKATGVI